MTSRVANCPYCSYRLSANEGQRVCCPSPTCKKVLVCVMCPHCMVTNSYKDVEFTPCAKIQCKSCSQPFQQLCCPHCTGSIMYRDCNFTEGSVVTCPYSTCGKAFQKLNCPNCKKSLSYSNADYKMGRAHSCPWPNCGKKFVQILCPQTSCSASLRWPGGNYNEGSCVECTTCSKKFSQVYCPHCDGRVVFRKGDYREGKKYTCPYGGCGKEFQQCRCGHCWQSIVWKGCGYKEGNVVNCPHGSCGKSFQHVLCPHCEGSVFFAENPKVPGQVYACPNAGCGKRFQQMNCRKCRRSVVYKNCGYLKGQRVKCPYENCEAEFYPKIYHKTDKEIMTEDQISQYREQKKQLKLPKTVRKALEKKKYPVKKVKYVERCQEWVKKWVDYTGDEKFTDEKFPANDQSIGPIEDKPCDWHRAGDIIGEGMVLFDNIEIDDVDQGSLGDCWFLSAISDICAYPTLIERLFLTRQINPAGIYEIMFCKNGNWSSVVVDDYLPCKKGTKNLIFAEPNGKEIWVLLLEKAYAKLHGSYKNIVSGFSADALSDLTGMPVNSYHFTDHEEIATLIKRKQLFPMLHRHHHSNHPLTTGTRDDVKEEECGLVGGHCYSIIDINSKHKILRLRNPWKNTEWTGEWGDKDSKWTPELKKELMYEDTDDGSFWISWNDVLKNFTNVHLCFYEKGWTERRIAIQKGQTIIVDVPENCDVICGMHQPDKRGKDSSYLYFPMGYILMDYAMKQVYLYEGCVIDRTTHSFGSRNNNYFFKTSLNKGKYLAIPIVNYMENKQILEHDRPIYFSLHSSSSGVKLTNTPLALTNVPTTVLNSSWKRYSEKDSTDKYGNRFIIIKYWNFGDVMYFVRFVSAEKYPKLKMTIKMNCENMIPLMEGPKEPFVFNAGETQFMGWFIRESGFNSYSSGYSYSWSTC